ncbi:MAG: flagellar basal body rod protein FlgF [Sphingomonas sp.]|nr:flagellar basal body rod protein FlgF [Sphingomonas sp.]
MDKLIYTAASGLKGHMAAQAAIANNMANASTIGFRADRVVFDQLSVQGPGLLARQPASEEVTDADRSAGTLTKTGRSLDVAVPGDAWIAVQATDGSEAYTRRGDLSVSNTGVLETGDGFPVIGASGPITVPPAQKVMIGPEGTISIVPLGAAPGEPMQEVGKIKLASVKGSDTVKGLDNLLHVRGGGVLPADLEAKLETGTLEGSNVNLTQALVDMIENQRSYEIQANLIKEAKNIDEGGASLMRLPS